MVALKRSSSRKGKPVQLLKKCLRREYDVLQRLQNISGVINGHSYLVGLLEDIPDTLVLDLAQLGSLSKLIKHTHVSESTAKYIFAQLAHTLDQIHASQVVHLDIKSENILIDEHF